MVSHKRMGGPESADEIPSRVEVGLHGAYSFHFAHRSLSDSRAIELVTSQYADVWLEVPAILVKGGQAVLTGEFPVVVGSPDEFGDLAHLVLRMVWRFAM
jgi:hypothetical protein